MKNKIIIVVSVVVILSIIIVAASLVLLKGPIDNEEFIEIITPLLERDAELNGYIWGDAFDTAEELKDEDIKASVPVYYAVSSSSPYKNIEELRKAAEELYSKELMIIVDQYAFENNDQVMARFCDDVDDDGKVIGLRVDVTANHTPYNLTTVVYINTATVKRSTNNMIEGEIEITSGSSGKRSTMEIRLLKEGDTWKLDTQTWISKINYE